MSMDKLVLVLNPVIVAMVLAYSYGMITRLTRHGRWRNVAMGVIMGVAAITAMQYPIPLGDGIIVDMRNLIIGLAAAFFGVTGAVIAVAFAGATRIMIGGVGMSSGLVAMIIAAAMGLYWAHSIHKKLGSVYLQRGLLALLISTHCVAAFWLPYEFMIRFFTELAPWVLVFNFAGVFLISTLISNEEKLWEQTLALQTAAATDPLTQLMNRRSVRDNYAAMPVARKPNHGTAMLCFDIDHFKQINDAFGHPLGDQVLLVVTSRVSGCLRPKDLFSRIGGDEFVIVLADVTQDETRAIAERCRATIGKSPLTVEGKKIEVTISIGADWTHQHPEFTSFLSLTDAALYKAKSLGRDCVAYAFNKTVQLQQGPISKRA